MGRNGTGRREAGRRAFTPSHRQAQGRVFLHQGGGDLEVVSLSLVAERVARMCERIKRVEKSLRAAGYYSIGAGADTKQVCNCAFVSKLRERTGREWGSIARFWCGISGLGCGVARGWGRRKRYAIALRNCGNWELMANGLVRYRGGQKGGFQTRLLYGRFSQLQRRRGSCKQYGASGYDDGDGQSFYWFRQP